MTLQSTQERMRELRLHGMLEALSHQQSQASYSGLGFEQRLAHLVDAEQSHRDTQRLQRLLKSAKLKYSASPEAIDYRHSRGLDRGLVADLLNCGWIERQQNALITGPTGTGKTWLACALGTQAARQGHSVLYKRTGRLLEEMDVAHKDGSLAKLRGQLVKMKLLVLDDFGLTGLNARGRSDLLEILDDRVGTGSTIMLGQMPVKDWHAFINDPALADAILDRLIHSSHKLELKGDSMRKRKSASAK
ncbi:IS21-like element helper ATPase IstB [Stenotrophomonas maltophilia]|jgi:DNA replication protein DnaC|uniref:IS21-like element helper ATPase IstB n=1 Tax=Stenotrophomonas maltophilia TaxID=40324 RepID=A0AA40Y3U5_STEMA|nr:IS21-like element helper ATPase IstB [Stenotrophomonas maltophilia]KOQ70947.1 ATPase AAA [Stenotrophomonas maltophilia]MBH1788772.1 IS21-like element helper ATPase IstB [Stenotrophomonas maltophilia]